MFRFFAKLDSIFANIDSYINKIISKSKIFTFLNNSKVFAGVILLTLNLFSKFITIKLSNNQEEFIKYAFGRQVLISTIAWLGNY